MVGVSGFNVKVCGYAIVMQLHSDIKKLVLEGETSLGELDDFMRRIKKVDEFVELFFSMGPYHIDVIYVMPPYKGFKGRLG